MRTKNWRNTVALGLASLSMLALAGCASIQQRIKDNPQAFNQATPAEQAMIKKGEVGVGFTPPLVKLALGDPDRITQRTDKNGTQTVWHYTQAVGGYASATFFGPGWGPWGPYYGPAFAPVYVVSAPAEERDRVRVVFDNGKVTSIERIVKN